MVVQKGDNAQSLADFLDISVEDASDHLAWSGFSKENGVFNLTAGDAIFDPVYMKSDEANSTTVNSNSGVGWDPDSYFKENFIPTLIGHEGRYQNDKTDGGNYVDGALVGTKHGISAPVLKSHLGRKITADDMKNLSKETAIEIYQKKYWDKPKVGMINDKDVAEQYADMYTNSGANAVKIMQRALNSIRQDVAVDGGIGPKTLGAINAADPEELHEAYKQERINYYTNLVKRKPSMSKWKKGRIKRANSFKYGD